MGHLDLLLLWSFGSFDDNYHLGKGGYIFGNVGLSVCLQTTLLKIVLNGSQGYFVEGSRVVRRTD